MKQKLLFSLLLAMFSLKALADLVPVAILSTDTLTLTFTYANDDTLTFAKVDGAPGAYNLLDKYRLQWTTWNFDSPIRKVVFDPSFAEIRVKSTSGWFLDLNKMDTIEGLEYLNTDSVTDMSYMFHNCKSLRTLDVSTFNTSKVTDMSGMFSYCKSLKTLDVSTFNTSNVITMAAMFADAGFEYLDLRSFNTSKVKDMSEMFYWSTKLKHLDISSFNPSLTS